MLLSIQETASKILSGNVLYVAGDEVLLKALPRGKWIGGTIPYFIAEQGGITTKDQIYVQEQHEAVTDNTLKMYDKQQLEQIVTDSPDRGFSVVIIPASSDVHIQYAQDAPDYQDIFYKQIIGWISGIHLDDLGKMTPKVINGQTGEISDQKAVVLHATLPESKMASIGIINIFNQGAGDTLQFPQDGFSIKECLVNGKPENFADYLMRKQIDLKLPLVANYHGAMINVSFQKIDEAEKRVDLYAPVFKDKKYRLAAPVESYVSAFQSHIPANLSKTEFSCNCILNYLYSELEGKKTGDLTGPMTFGEIAYQLLNQTLVYLCIQDV